jgi:ubiquinone/menaquinone biosynthesis C-methylase UbiE
MEIRCAIPELLDFSVKNSEVWDTIKPFVTRIISLESDEWCTIEKKVRHKVRGALRERLIAFLRLADRPSAQAEIDSRYSTRWSQDGFSPFHFPSDKKGGTPFKFDGRGFRMYNSGYRRARLLYIMRLIEQLRPNSVLEVGFGEGLNLALLSARYPHIKFSGIELTAGGIGAAKGLQGESLLPDFLSRFSPLPLSDSAAHRRVDFRRGSAAEMPWPDGSFDLVFTSLALEQMEGIRHAALSEIARLCGKYTLLLEPFLEFNRSGLNRKYLWSKKYFRGAIRELHQFGISPGFMISDLPEKLFLKPVIVVCSKL